MNTPQQTNYTEDNIRTLEPREHVRLRPGMYIGKLGDGSAADDGIYILLKEVLDNSIDEFRMKFGKRIDVKINDGKVTVRDYGRGIPLGKIVDVVSKMNTGGKYDDGAFKKSIGLNGVGTKAVNFLSTFFQVKSVRDGKTKSAQFHEGKLVEVTEETDTTEKNGTEVSFIPDSTIFVNYKYSKAGNYIVTCEFLRNGPTVTGIAWPKYYLWISIFNPDTYDLAADGAIRLALLGYEEATRKVDITDYVCFNNEKQNKEDFTRVFPQAVCEKIFYRNNIK